MSRPRSLVEGSIFRSSWSVTGYFTILDPKLCTSILVDTHLQPILYDSLFWEVNYWPVCCKSRHGQDNMLSCIHDDWNRLPLIIKIPIYARAERNLACMRTKMHYSEYPGLYVWKRNDKYQIPVHTNEQCTILYFQLLHFRRWNLLNVYSYAVGLTRAHNFVDPIRTAIYANTTGFIRPSWIGSLSGYHGFDVI